MNATTRGAHPLIEVRDMAIASWLIFLAPFAWLLPRRLWGGLTVATGWCAAHVHPGRHAARVRRIRRICRDHPDLPSPQEIDTRVMAGKVQANVQYLREARPGGWRPRIDVEGREHVEEAFEAGSGCVLWVAPLRSAGLIAKKGLRAVGIDVTHLSREYHGPSDSRLGRLLLNPVKVAPETRYVRERLALPDGSELRSTRILIDRLRDNRAVSITCTFTGARRITSRVLGGRISIASGAPSLCLATGAALLPVFVLEPRPGVFRIVVEEAIEPSTTGTRHEKVDDLVHRYATRLEAYVERYPHLFVGWHELAVDETA